MQRRRRCFSDEKHEVLSLLKQRCTLRKSAKYQMIDSDDDEYEEQRIYQSLKMRAMVRMRKRKRKEAQS